MKLHYLAIATLCFVGTELNIFIKAHNGSDSIYSEQSTSLSTKLTQNTQSNPQSAEDYFNRGVSYFNSGQKEEALVDYNQAILV